MASEDDDTGSTTVAMNINAFADEVLVNIFAFLPSIDLQNVAKVCQRFHYICCDKNVVGNLNFCRQYNLTCVMLNEFLRPKLRYLNITGINLNHCYWFLSTQLQFLSKLKNLKHLEILDCRVTLKSLLRIIKGVQLETLSWTWDNSIEKGDLNKMCWAVFNSSLSHLRSLKIQVTSPFQLSQVCFLLNCCRELKYLTVCESSTSFNVLPMPTSAPYELMLPELCRAKFDFHMCMGFGLERFIYEILCSALPSDNLQGIWTCQGSCSVLMKLYEQNLITIPSLQELTMLSLDGYRSRSLTVIRDGATTEHATFVKKVLQQGSGLSRCLELSLDWQRMDLEIFESMASNCRSLRSLSLKDCQIKDSPVKILEGLKLIADLCQCLTSLNLLGTHIHSPMNPCTSLVNAKNLESLALPACFLAWAGESPRVDSSESFSLGSFYSVHSGSVREGVRSSCTVEEIENARLFPLTIHCPKMKMCVIKADSGTTPCEKICREVMDKDLICIHNWKSLQTLIMHNLPGVIFGNFLPKVCQGCSELQYLSLSDIGPKGCFKYHLSLMEALPYCLKLKDFRLVQRYDVIMHRLQNALTRCQNLERLTVFSEHGPSSLEMNEMIEFVELMPKLIALYLVLPATAKNCKLVSQGLEKRFTTTRPAFNCAIAQSKGYFLAEGQSMPSCHREEMVRDLLDTTMYVA